MLYSVFWLLNEILQLFIYVLIATAIFSWLEAFGILDSRNRTVYKIGDVLDRLTTPVLAPVRRFVPLLGGIDISFIIVFLLCRALQIFLGGLYSHLAMAGLS